MSNNNNIYNILNSFNKIAQEPKTAATEQSASAKKTKLEESMEQVLHRKLIAEKKAKPDFLDLDKDGDKKEPMKKAAKDKNTSVNEGSTKVAKKLTPIWKKIVVRARQRLEQLHGTMEPEEAYEQVAYEFKIPVEKLYALLDHPDVNEGTDEKVYRHKGTYGTSYDGDDTKKPEVKRGRGRPKKGSDSETGEVKKYDWSAFGATGKDIKLPKHAGPVTKHKMAGEADVEESTVQEKAPPGAKAERMVKHIKAGYAKDGKLTDKEKGIAYATAWKAHNKGKVEETIKSLISAGYTKEQIVEGWEEMMKGVEQRNKEETGTGKFDKEKTSTGTKYTRKYDPKSGESEDTGKDGEGQEVKRGRGRPKKVSESTKTIDRLVSSLFENANSGVVQGSANPLKRAAQNFAAKAVGAAGKVVRKGLDTLGHGSDEELLKDLEKRMQKEDELEESLNQMRRIAGLPVVEAKKADKDYDGDGKIESGKDEYLGSRIAAAKKAGKLKEGEICTKCDCDPCECDDKDKVDECMSPIGGMAQAAQDAAGKMSVSTNMSSDGTKSVNISADGDAAEQLMQMLKLAGMGSGHEPNVQDGADTAHPGAIEVHGTMDADGAEDLADELRSADEEEVDEEKDPRYDASTTPDEHVMPVQSQTKGGDGDVAGQEKKMHKHGYKFSDNPMGMSESASLKLMKEYESIKVKK